MRRIKQRGLRSPYKTRLCLYALIRAYTGISYGDLAHTLGIREHAIKGRKRSHTSLTEMELLRICERTGMDWAEIGALIELSAQGTENTSDLLHENSKTHSARKRKTSE